MATETNDYESVLRFIDRIKAEQCFTAPHKAPDWLRRSIPYLDLGLSVESKTGAPNRHAPPFQVFVTGWFDIEGVLILTPEHEFPADVRAAIAATNERALRDLLLAFPRSAVGFFYVGGTWPLNTLAAVFDGQVMPAREGYYATHDSFVPDRTHDVRRLDRTDYDIVHTQWSEHVWEEILAENYSVYACQAEGKLQALCFHKMSL